MPVWGHPGCASSSKGQGTSQKQGLASAIIFIDEIEVLGGKRGSNSSHLEYDQTLNQLLVCMDGINSEDEVRILVIAATNRADLMDDALLRPGRFDRIVKLTFPTRRRENTFSKFTPGVNP